MELLDINVLHAMLKLDNVMPWVNIALDFGGLI